MASPGASRLRGIAPLMQGVAPPPGAPVFFELLSHALMWADEIPPIPAAGGVGPRPGRPDVLRAALRRADVDRRDPRDPGRGRRRPALAAVRLPLPHRADARRAGGALPPVLGRGRRPVPELAGVRPAPPRPGTP